MSNIKGHSYDIFKLYLYQIGITVFSLIIITALGSISDSVLFEVAISVFTTLFFSVLIYTSAWDLGARDKLSVEAGRAQRCAYKGVLLGVFANLPNFILTGFAAIAFAVSLIGGSDAFYSIGGVLLTIAKFTMAIYLSFINHIPSIFGTMSVTVDALVTSIVAFLMPLIAIGITELGYYLGLKEHKLFGGTMDAKRK
jgi:hypothetical protein